MAATPPMKTTVPTPPSPLHGGRYDTYHATRKSTRHTTTRRTRVTETPPPTSSKLSQKSQSSSQKKSSFSPTHFTSPPPSTHTSPRKRAKRNTDGQNTSVMNGEDSSRAASEDPFYNPAQNPTLQQPSFKIGANMLPTPVKTPRKKPIGQAALNAGGRVLFPDRPEDPMPVPRKIRKGKRHVGFSLFGSTEDEEDCAENEISIYTDSKDKVPEIDLSEDNPFLDKPDEVTQQPEPSKKRGSRKRKVPYGLDGSKEIEEAFNREEGMVYVFRGKKVYRKFPIEGDDEDEEEEVADPSAAPAADISTSRPRSLTRASIKPRLLFPTASQKAKRSKSDIEAEEATTDIDDPEPDHDTQQDKRTPVKATFHGLAPDTPPDTGHVTRSATKRAARGSSLSSSPAVSPVKVDFGKQPPSSKGKKVSPFDGWARTKPGGGTPGAGVGKGRKRAAAEAVEEASGEVNMEGTSAKRVKSGADV